MVSLYFLEWTDVFKPVKSGFNCHDRSLSLPYIDPNHEVIPLLMLLSLAFAGPAITVRMNNTLSHDEIHFEAILEIICLLTEMNILSLGFRIQKARLLHRYCRDVREISEYELTTRS